MTRKSKIEYLNKNAVGVKIEAEFNSKLGRLIVKSIQVGDSKFTYTTHSRDQADAGLVIDHMYWEETRNQ